MSKGLAKANPNLPLVPGFRDGQVAEPLKLLAQKIEDAIADIDMLNRNFGGSVNSIIQKHVEMKKEFVSISNAVEALIVMMKEKDPENFNAKFESARSAATRTRAIKEEKEFEQKYGYADVDDEIKVGDTIVADVYLKNPETQVVMDKFEYAPFIVGKHLIFPDFDANFLGMKPGESKTIESYEIPALHQYAGVKVGIEIKIHKVKRAKVKETTNETSNSVQ